MKRILLIWIMCMLFVGSFATAVCDVNQLESNIVLSYYLEENDAFPYVDSNGTLNITAGTKPDRVTGQIEYGQDFDDAGSEYIETINSNSVKLTDPFFISMWVNKDGSSGTTQTLASTVNYGPPAYGWYLEKTGSEEIGFYLYEGIGGNAEKWKTASISANTWTHVLCKFVASEPTCYIDGSSSGSNFESSMTGSDVVYDTNHNLILGKNNPWVGYYDGIMDEVIYGNYDIPTDCITYLATTTNHTPNLIEPPPANITYNDSVESTAVVKQVGTIDVNTPALSTIISTTYNIPQNSTELYGEYNFNIESNLGNSAYCELKIDGVSFANITRTNIAGQLGSISLMTPHFSQDSGNHTQELACSKNGAGKFTISNAVGIGHIMLDENLNLIPHDGLTLTNQTVNSGSFSKVGEINFTISNRTTVNILKHLVIEWSATYKNNDVSTEVLSTYLSINGTNCSKYPRTVGSGNIGSVGGDCLMENVTTNTTYNIKLYANGTNAEYSGNLILKEFILSDEEIAGGQGALVGATFTGDTDTKLINISGGNLNHGITNVFQKQAYSIMTNESTNVNMYIVLNNSVTMYTVNMTRDFLPNTIGVLIGHDVFENIPQDNYTISVYANCGNPTASCTIMGGAGIGYITDVTTTIFEGFIINAKDLWDNQTILNYTSIDGVTYTTTNGTIEYYTTNELENFTIVSEYGNGYINQTFVNYNTSNNLNLLLYQTIVNIESEEINTLKKLLNWTIHTNSGVFHTLNGTVTIYPKLNNYTNWNWTKDDTYFNASSLDFSIQDRYKNFTISNLFARNMYFTDSITGATLTPSCEQNTFIYNSYAYHTHESITNTTCNLFGYDNLEISNTIFPINSSHSLTPVALALTFSENTSGIIQAGDTYIAEFINVSEINLSQINITNDYVKITFNPDVTGKYQQIFSYFNDLNTTIKENILVQNVDLVQEIRVTGNTQALVNARVCAQYPNNETYFTTYCDFTGNTGDVNIQVNDQNTYLFCVQAEGYEPKCELKYIPPSNQDLITINMVSTDSQSGTNYISSTCSGVYLTDKSCTMNVITYRPYYSICLNFTKTIGNISTETQTCSYDSVSESFLYNLETTYDSYNLEILLSNEIAGVLNHINGTDNVNRTIDYEAGNNNGQNLRDKIHSNVAYIIFVYFLFLIIGVIAGYMFEKYFNGMGVYGAGIWFLFLGVAKFYIFWVPAVLIIVHFIMEKVLPMFEN